MSIKIIKNTLQEPTEITCPACFSVFTYTYDEIQRDTTCDIFGLSKNYRLFIVCPVCKNDIGMPRVSCNNYKEKNNETN